VFNVKDREISLAILLLFILIVSVLDLLADLSHGVDYEHVIKEVGIIAFSTIAIIFLLFSWYQQKDKIKQLQQEIATIHDTKIQVPKYVLDTRIRLSTVIKQQFTDWKLSDSEREIAWFLLKGLTLKEISAIRKTQEKTIRQQASSIYKKSGLSGRHVLSAWFIEDIL